jgi:hypothetical protein
MKISSAISVAVLSLIIAIMLIAVGSMYEATYGSSGSVSVVSENVAYSPSGVVLNAVVRASNYGYLPANLEYFNNTVSIPGSSDGLMKISFPLNISSLMNGSYPVKNVVMNISLLLHMASYVFSVMIPLTLKGIKILAPFENFTISKVISRGNGSYLLSASFFDLVPQILNFTRISVLLGSTVIGNFNLTCATQQGSLMTTSFVVKNVTNSGGPVDLTFRAGVFTWHVNSQHLVW